MFVLQRHPDGVASVAFKEPEEADACIQSFNGRWFGGRQLSVQLWDGTTDYQVHQHKIQTSLNFNNLLMDQSSELGEKECL